MINLTQQRQSHSDAPPCGGACSGRFRFLTAGSQNARGTLAARAANKIPRKADHQRPNFRSNPRLDRGPLCCDQRDGTLANDFMVIADLNAKRRASFSQPFNPPSQFQRRSRWDWPLVLYLDGPTHHDFCDGVYVPLHLTDADGFNHGNQVPSRQAFNQSFRVTASMRKPRKQCPCRLLRRHAVGFFKENFTDALMVHEDWGKGCRSTSARRNPAQSGATETVLDPRADEPHDKPNQAFSSVVAWHFCSWRWPHRSSAGGPFESVGCRCCWKLKRARHTCRARHAKNTPATRRGILLTRLRQRLRPLLRAHLLHPLLPVPPVLQVLVPATLPATNRYPQPVAQPRWPARSS